MLTYKKAGVDIDKASLFKKEIAAIARKSAGSEVLKGIGSFGSFFDFSKERYRNPVLVSSSDGVGTKLKIAVLANRHDTVGIDAVAMNVNDILCCGAKPLFFLDYIAYSKVDSCVLLDIVKGLNAGCIQAGCSLVGGETAQMPDMYNKGEYDLAGFSLGVVEKNNIIDGSKIEAGDVLIGIASSGLHSNGFSLARKVFSKNEMKRYASELLKPTRIYVKPVLSLLRTTQNARRITIKGIAHITGGAFYNKVARILPSNLDARIDKNSWRANQIFKLIQNKGNISEREMYRTFNMGIGMVLVVSPQAQGQVKSSLSRMNLNSWVIGEIIKGKKEVIIF
ncbi:MAG: phosphoribosylformylglycinamidine cyclo-ligase [Candidatus Omnitrophica bacterium]|nr:phosphoribosylformylglycinamidine cyclo-ligase [Candidatus Omnitrophota bacterium]